MAAPALWLALDLPALPLSALADPRPALAVIQSRGSRRWLVAARDTALPPGTDLGTARKRRPETVAVERRPAREREALEALACCAYDRGDRISWRIDEPERDFELPRCTLWLEIGASLKLFGGLDALCASIEADCQALGHAPRLGVAPTLEAAALLARSGGGRATGASELAAALAPLSLDLLALPAPAIELLHDIGLRRCADLLALPRDALTRRIGTDALRYLERLTGSRPDLRRWWQPPPRFAHRFDLIEEVEDTERLAFPLRRLLVELVRYLGARDTAVQQFRLELTHGRDRDPSVLDFILTQPGRDEATLQRVLRERLAATRLPAPVRSLRLSADHFTAPAAGQHDLFDRSRQTDDEAAAVLDRLAARLGAAAVWRPQLVDDHRPERAWRAAPVHEPVAALPAPVAPRPTLLLRTPRRLQRPPPLIGGIERIESGWWDGADVRRDYFSCELPDGARGWAYLDQADGQIYLQGLWS
jgi:protein ImuB